MCGFHLYGFDANAAPLAASPAVAGVDDDSIAPDAGGEKTRRERRRERRGRRRGRRRGVY